MDYAKLTAPCGLDCFNCRAYAANENEEVRSALSEKWNIPSEEARCRGCREEKGTIPMRLLGKKEPCSVFTCTQQKKIYFCCDCPDFPCDNLHPYADKAGKIPHNTKVFNLCLIRKMGLKPWAQHKAKKVKETYFEGEWKL